MFEFILAPQNIPFTTAIAVMLMIAALEVFAAFMGVGLSEILDRFIPSADLDIDAPDFKAPGILGKVFSWLSIKRVPVLIIIIVFLFIFGVVGWMIQDMMLSFAGFMLPPLLAAAIASVATFPLLRGATNLLSKVIPKDETSAISRDALIGRTAKITLGTARKGYPSQAKVKDRHGTVHYFMVEPDEAEEIFNQGDDVLLVKHDGVRFYAIRAKSSR